MRQIIQLRRIVGYGVWRTKKFWVYERRLHISSRFFVSTFCLHKNDKKIIIFPLDFLRLCANLSRDIGMLSNRNGGFLGNKGAWFNGRTSVSKTADEGSIPSAPAKCCGASIAIKLTKGLCVL